MSYVRAVGLVIHKNQILLMHRSKDGKEYDVFPGGHQEADETLEQATLREVFEETSIEVAIVKQIYHHLYDDGSERVYSLCRYLSGEPKLRPGPEMDKMNEKDQYKPHWVTLADLPKTLVYPLEIRDWLLEDLKQGFGHPLRKAHVIFKNLRQSL